MSSIMAGRKLIQGIITLKLVHNLLQATVHHDAGLVTLFFYSEGMIGMKE